MAEPSTSSSGLHTVIVDPTFWVMVCVLIFVGIVIQLGIPRQIVAALDNRKKQIDAELEEARRLREEAQEILASAERDQIKAKATVEQILNSAHADNRRVTEAARRDLTDTLRRRRMQAEQNVATAEHQAHQRLTRQLTDLACRAALVAASQNTDDTHLDQDIARACDQLRHDR